MPLINSVFCLSLRTASIIIAAMATLFSTFVYVMILTHGIVWRMEHYTAKERIAEVLEVLTYEYNTAIQMVFGVVLLIGCIKEVSYCVLGWLVVQVSLLATSVIETVLITGFYSRVFPEEIMATMVISVLVFIVYCQYDLMEKPEPV